MYLPRMDFIFSDVAMKTIVSTRLQKPAIQFLKDTAGGVTAEFVIVFPILLATVMFVVFVSLYIAATSELQNIAHELVRGSFKYMDEYSDIDDFCDRVSIDELTAGLSGSLFLASDRITLTDCLEGELSGTIIIGLSYDFYGSVINSFAKYIGLDVGVVKRLSVGLR